MKNGKAPPKSREKKSSEPTKKIQPIPEVMEGPKEASTSAKTPKEEKSQEKYLKATTEPGSLPEPEDTEEPSKMQEGHVILSSESGEDSDGGATETRNSHGTPKRPQRGRKLEKEKREENSYRDIVQGSQQTIPEMISTRSTRKQGKALKGATTLKIVK